jgi:hypothetical protein
MASYFPPEQNLPIFDPSVFKRDSETLTIAQADTRYCRFNTAQGTMNFSNMNVFGDASFNQDVSVAGTLTAGTLNFNDLSVNSLSVGSGDINMNSNDINNVRTITSDSNLNLNAGASSGGVRTNHQIVTSSTSFDKRQITTSYYNLCDGGSAITSIISTGRIFSLGAQSFFDFTILNNSSINFLIKRANVNYTPLVMTDVSTFKTNIVQDVMGSSITQSALSSDTTLNTLKNTQIVTNYGGPSANTALDIYDSGGSRGVRIVPFAGNGNYSNLTTLNDSVIVSRFRPPGGNIGLTIGLVDSTGTGIRFSSETSTKGRVQIRAGGSNTITILDDSDISNPDTTTFNQKIRMIGATSASRSLGSVSRLGLFDTNGIAGAGEIFISSTSNEFFYASYTNGNSHSFYVNDGVNNIRRFSISNTSTIQNVPSDTSGATSFTSSQNGFTDNVNASITHNPSTTIAAIASIILTRRGTYTITLSVSLTNVSNITDMTNVNNHWGLQTNSTTLPMVGLLASSVIKQQNLFVLKGGTNIVTTSSCVFRATGDNTLLYFNGFADYAGPTFGELQYNISWSKHA